MYFAASVNNKEQVLSSLRCNLLYQVPGQQRSRDNGCLRCVFDVICNHVSLQPWASQSHEMRLPVLHILHQYNTNLVAILNLSKLVHQPTTPCRPVTLAEASVLHPSRKSQSTKAYYQSANCTSRRKSTFTALSGTNTVWILPAQAFATTWLGSAVAPTATRCSVS